MTKVHAVPGKKFMPEIPIVFDGGSVRGILEGKKAQTRRVIEPQPEQNRLMTWFAPEETDDGVFWEAYDLTSINGVYEAGDQQWSGVCPYGASGRSLLWVRETWRIGSWNHQEGSVAIDYKADGHSRQEWLKVPDEDQFERLWIQSTDDAIEAGLEHDDDGIYRWKPGASPCRWRSPIHMPKWASRLQLAVEFVHVDRLKNISTEDCIAEGIQSNLREYDAAIDLREQFQKRWDSNHAKAYSWESNPWVWAINFERKKHEDRDRKRPRRVRVSAEQLASKWS